MMRWPKNHMWCMGLFLTAILLLLAGCSGGGGDNCGGIDDIVSCVYVTDVEPVNAQVDIADCNADGVPDPPVNPDTVTVSFRNDLFPTFVDPPLPGGLPVQINHVSVTYVPRCGPGQVCPSLSGHDEAVFVFIEDDGGTAATSVTLVSAFTKGQYAGLIPDPDNPAAYTANLVFEAQTIGFEDNFDIDVSVPFTIGNFSCP